MSRAHDTFLLFVAESDDGIDAGGAMRWDVAREQSYDAQ